MPDPAFADLIPVGQFMTTLITMGGLGWWMNSQFNGLRKEMNSQITALGDKFINKLETHEAQDSTRFANLTNDIWLIKLRNAARDNGLTKEAHTA